MLLQTESVFSVCWGWHHCALRQEDWGAAAAGHGVRISSGVEQPPGSSGGALLSFKGRHNKGNGRVSFRTVLWPLQEESCPGGIRTIFYISSRPLALFAWTSLGREKSVGIKDGATRPAAQVELCQVPDVGVRRCFSFLAVPGQVTLKL